VFSGKLLGQGAKKKRKKKINQGGKQKCIADSRFIVWVERTGDRQKKKGCTMDHREGGRAYPGSLSVG